jgi:hypothetical protein
MKVRIVTNDIAGIPIIEYFNKTNEKQYNKKVLNSVISALIQLLL